MEQFAHGWVTGAENRHKSSLVQAGKSEEAALYVRRIHEANVVAAEAAKAAAEALAMAEELAAAIVSCSVEMRE